MGTDDLSKMRRDAEACAVDARKRPGLYETNGHVIADLYDCIARLAAAREREAKLREAVRWIRDKAETGAWCQSDIVWFADEVLAGRNPYEKVQP